MPVDPKYKWDVFLSYAHVDDLPIGGQEGWVSGFVTPFRNALAQSTGAKDVAVWHDRRMRANETFDSAIEEAIANSAVFLVLMSPAWANSAYCAKEADWFQSCAARTGLRCGNLSRLVGIRLGAVSRECWLKEIRGQHQPVCFFEEDAPGGLPIEPSSPAYRRRLGELVDAVRSVLLEMKNQRERKTALDEVWNPLPPARSQGSAIYIASSGRLATQRAALVADIEQFRAQTGAVIPVESAPEGGPESQTRERIQEAMGRCAMSVHLLGGEPEEKPLALVELEIALSQPRLSRPLVWLPREVDIDNVDSKAQTKLLQALRDTGRLPGMTPGATAEFLHADFERLKSEVHRRAVPPAVASRAAPRVRGRRRQLIYVSHRGLSQRGQGRSEALAGFEKSFDPSAFEVWTLDHSSPNAGKMHSTNLKFCDGFAVVFSGDHLDWAEELAHEALIAARVEDRPRALAAVELPPAAGRDFATRADSLTFIRWSSGGSADQVGQFVNALAEPLNA